MLAAAGFASARAFAHRLAHREPCGKGWAKRLYYINYSNDKISGWQKGWVNPPHRRLCSQIRDWCRSANKTETNGLGDGLYAVHRIELVSGRAQIGIDRMDRETEILGDFFADPAVAGKLQAGNLTLAAGRPAREDRS